MPAIAMRSVQRVTTAPTDVDGFEPDRDDVYLPSPREIAMACAEIQAGWSETERARRARGMAGQPRGQKLVERQTVRLLLDRRRVAEDWAA